jgi:hypothetical protein
MSEEEEYYKDILTEEDASDKYEEESETQTWGSETIPPPPLDEEDSYDSYESYPPPIEDKTPRSYGQEYYGGDYYDDYQYGEGEGEDKTPWFWIGVLVAVGLSAIVMIIFHFVGAATHPGLAYIEIVLLLLCTTIPGLFIRKVGKGILGGMLVFAVQFFIPLIVFYASGENPAAFFSPYFVILNALGLIKMGFNDLLNFTFLEIPTEVEQMYAQYGKFTSFIWLLDLLIMFAIMIVLVGASSWLCANLFTEKAKTVWTWIFLPFQIGVIITNLIITPWFLLGVSSTTQMVGALAAGGANLAEVGMPLAENANITDIESIDTEDILAHIERADEWFAIAQSNYRGLDNLLFIRMSRLFAGRYGPIIDVANHTIYAGFELLKAMEPLAHGILDNANNTDVEVDGLVYQFDEIMAVYEEFESMFNATGNGTKPSETQLEDIELDIELIIDDLDYLIENFFHDAAEYVINTNTILQRINPQDLRDINARADIQQTFNEMAGVIENITTIANDYTVLMPFLLDFLDNIPHLIRSVLYTLIGNVRLFLGYQFDQCQVYLQDAADELVFIDAIFSPARETEVSESETALGLYHFFEDAVDFISPVILEESSLSGTFEYVIVGLDGFVDNSTGNCDLLSTDYNTVFNSMNQAIDFSEDAVAYGAIAGTLLTTIETRATNDEYAMLSDQAENITGMISDYFLPEPYAQITNNLALAVNSTFGAVQQVALNNSAGVVSQLDLSINYIDDAIAIINANPDTPINATTGFFIEFRDAMVDIKSAVESAPPGNIAAAIPQIESMIEQLWTEIHNIIDDGLPP